MVSGAGMANGLNIMPLTVSEPVHCGGALIHAYEGLLNIKKHSDIVGLNG